MELLIDDGAAVLPRPEVCSFQPKKFFILSRKPIKNYEKNRPVAVKQL